MAIITTKICKENKDEDSNQKKLLTKIPITRTKRPINTSKTPINKSTICKICSKDFVFPSELAKHLKYHDDSRKYKCVRCNLRFLNMVGLTAHKRSHKEKCGKISKK